MILILQNGFSYTRGIEHACALDLHPGIGVCLQVQSIMATKKLASLAALSNSCSQQKASA